MHIDSLEVYQVTLPLRQTTRMPWGDDDKLQTVVVRLASEGLSGWGEASPGNAPVAHEEWAGGVFQCLRDWLAPTVVGQSFSSGEELQKQLERFRGNRFAKAALDTAWWDLEARRQGKPLHELLDGRQPAIEVGPTLEQMEHIEDLLAALREAFAAGYGRVGLKFRPGWDVQMVNFVRQDFATETIHIDCEGNMRLDHMEMLCRLDDFHLAMINQPLPADDLVGHAMVQETIRTPVCLDQAITTLDQANMALELKSCQFMRIEPGRVGGITPAVAIHDACHEDCTPCWVGAAPQSAIGTRLGLALASKANFTYPADHLPADLLEADLAEAPAAVRDPADGRLRVPLWTTPGIGVEPDLALLEKYATARAKLS